MSTDIVPISTAGQPAAPSTVPIPGTNTGGGSAASAPSVIPIATPEPQAFTEVSPVSLPDGVSLPSYATQAQLSQAVAALSTSIAKGAKPIVTRPDGTKEEIVIDNNNTIGVEPVS